jgi:integrase
MAAHIKKRKDRRSVWYLVDGAEIRSLKTTKKGVAEQLLKKYIQGKYSLSPLPTVKEYYDKWIKAKIPPLFRPAQKRDYEQHFSKHILAKWTDSEGHVRKFGTMRLDVIGTGDLVEFRTVLLAKGLTVKTARNIIDSSFRALYRDARAECRELQGYDPFLSVQWPRSQREKPDPFTAEERDRIIDYWIKNDFFYYPWVFILFHTGMRPSEASALTWSDADLAGGTISISKSRYMGDDSAPKTSASKRTIRISEAVIKALELLPSRALGLKHVFVNKDGKPMNAKKWSEHNWGEPLKKLDPPIRHRKFYATRHTFITEQIKQGENPLAVAQYCGTSVVMIEKDYCGTLGLSFHQQKSFSDQTKIEPERKFLNKNMVAGPGFEPGTSRL